MPCMILHPNHGYLYDYQMLYSVMTDNVPRLSYYSQQIHVTATHCNSMIEWLAQ